MEIKNVERNIESISIEIKGKGKVCIEAHMDSGNSVQISHGLEDKKIAAPFLPAFKTYLQSIGVNVGNFDALADEETHSTPDV